MESRPDEYTLALRAQRGDRQALAELVERTRHRLFALAYAHLRHYDDAHDAVASALLYICLHIQELRQPAHVVSWMQTIVRTQVKQRWRDRRVSALDLKAAQAPNTDINPSLLRLDIEQALRHLPERQADALRLFYLAEWSVREIAQQMGNSEDAVKMWLHRGRKHLAEEMKGYAPMTSPQTPSRKACWIKPRKAAGPQIAILLHSDLEPALIAALTAALQTGGYTPHVLTPDQLGDPNQRAIVRIERFKSAHLLILDEQIGGRSPLEYILNLRANSDTRDIPLCLLYSVAPDDLTGMALFNAGVDRLLDKTNAEEIARFANPVRILRTDGWDLVSDLGKRVVYLAQQEAVRWQENWVSTEHLLLALVRSDLCPEQPVPAVRILQDYFGLSPERVRAETERALQPGSGWDERQDMQLTPTSQRVFDLAYDEARLWGKDRIGTEHLLLGLVREGTGVAGQVLARLGIEREAVSLVRSRQAGG